MSEITDGVWYKNAISQHINPPALSDLHDPFLPQDKYTPFVITIEQYQDATGTDSKESHSLEPVVLSTGLLKSEFKADSSSRFIIGYIPSFSQQKSSAAQTQRSGSLAGFGSTCRDYHKCLAIILEPLVKAQREHPLMEVRLGDQLKRVRAILLMGAVLGDGKSNDMLCGRVGAFSNTLRLSRATFTPSHFASDTGLTHHWIRSNVIEHVTRAAMYKSTAPGISGWRTHLANLPTKSERSLHERAAKRRARISTLILKKALGSHAVNNAFFSLDFASDHGIFGHTLADVMHFLEEGLMKYLLSVFLDPLSSKILANLDDYVAKLLGASANRCFGRRAFSRVNFTRGFSRLTLLSSEERVGALVAVLVVMQTDKGRTILEERFFPDFDEKRKERAARFEKKVGDVDDPTEDTDGEMEDVEDAQAPPTIDVSSGEEEAAPSSQKRSSTFTPTKPNIRYVCRQIRCHDLTFLLDHVFPHIPEPHVYECLNIIWHYTHRLSEEVSKMAFLPLGELNLPPYRRRTHSIVGSSAPSYSDASLLRKFFDYKLPTLNPAEEDGQPTIATDPNQFVECCEKLLALRSFYIHSGEHCPDAIPRNPDGTFDVKLVEERTRDVGECLKATVNRGEGTNGWKIPKFIDMLLLPQYMARLASTGRFHVGFAERGLKN